MVRLAIPLLLILAWRVPAWAEPEPSASEVEMLRLVNQERSRHGLGALTLDAGLSEVARSHSRDMIRNNFVGHVSPTTGQLKDRFFAARIRAAKMSENVAFHRSVPEAHEGLMNSPGHRKNILDPDVTVVGIGVVASPQGQVYVTQNFARLMPEVDVAQAPYDFIQRINEKRAELRMKPLESDAELNAVCRANSQSMASAGEIGCRTAQRLFKKQQAKFRECRFFAFFCEGLQVLDDSEGLLDPSFTHLGIGMVLHERKDGYGMFWVTLLVASQRR
jgi:uncharacterized protein YkwD